MPKFVLAARHTRFLLRRQTPLRIQPQTVCAIRTLSTSAAKGPVRETVTRGYSGSQVFFLNIFYHRYKNYFFT